MLGNENSPKVDNSLPKARKWLLSCLSTGTTLVMEWHLQLILSLSKWSRAQRYSAQHYPEGNTKEASASDG